MVPCLGWCLIMTPVVLWIENSRHLFFDALEHRGFRARVLMSSVEASRVETHLRSFFVRETNHGNKFDFFFGGVSRLVKYHTFNCANI